MVVDVAVEVEVVAAVAVIVLVVVIRKMVMPFPEARFGVEIFVELYDSTPLSPVPSYVLGRYITPYFIAFTVVVYCYYGFLSIS